MGDLYLPIEQLRGAPGPLCKFGWCHDGKIYFFVFVVTATKFEPVFPSKGALLLHWGGRPPPAAAAAAAAGGGLPPPALNPTAAALGSTPPASKGQLLLLRACRPFSKHLKRGPGDIRF